MLQETGLKGVAVGGKSMAQPWGFMPPTASVTLTCLVPPPAFDQKVGEKKAAD